MKNHIKFRLLNQAWSTRARVYKRLVFQDPDDIQLMQQRAVIRLINDPKQFARRASLQLECYRKLFNKACKLVLDGALDATRFASAIGRLEINLQFPRAPFD